MLCSSEGKDNHELLTGVKCNFKVAGMVNLPGPPVKVCGLLSMLHQAPCIFSQAVTLTKFRSTGSLEKLQQCDS